jgi:hypothetical protein
MNLRNMLEAGVDQEIITNAIQNANLKGIYPFQVMRAYRMVKEYQLSTDLIAAIENAALQ